MRWMRRLARWIFVIAADLSLLLFVCSAVFWVRGYFVQDMVDVREPWWLPMGAGQFEYHYRQTTAHSCQGEFGLTRQHSISVTTTDAKIAAARIPSENGGGELFFHHQSPPAPSPRAKGVIYLFDRFGFRVGYLTLPMSGTMTMKVVGGAAPFWSVVALFGVLPGIRGILWMRKKPGREGTFCQGCGYDLRESKGRCPECGKVLESAH